MTDGDPEASRRRQGDWLAASALFGAIGIVVAAVVFLAVAFSTWFGGG